MILPVPLSAWPNASVMMSVVDAWLGLPMPLMFLCLALGLGANVLVLFVVVFRTRLGNWLRRCTGIVAPFFGSVAILFSLLTGFLANDVWERNRQAARSVLSETDNVRALYNLSIASASDMGNIRRAIRAYVQSVVRDEWPGMVTHKAAPQVEAALAELLQQVSEPHITTEAGSAVHGAMLTRVMQVGTARHDRLLLSDDRSDEFKWVAVIALALFTQVAIGAVHLERARAFLLTLTIFTTAAVVTLGLIAGREQPFASPQLSAPVVLRAWLAEVERSTP